MRLPLEAIEFGAFGGTNFAKTELLRDSSNSKELFEPLSLIGMDAIQMVEAINEILETKNNILCKQVIISGGIKTFLDGYFLIKKCKIPSVYGQASSLLKFAKEDYELLREYVANQIQGLEMAYSFLTIRE